MDQLMTWSQSAYLSMVQRLRRRNAARSRETVGTSQAALSICIPDLPVSRHSVVMQLVRPEWTVPQGDRSPRDRTLQSLTQSHQARRPRLMAG